ncbi:MAG: ACP S-malonyltransferase [Candidatus Dasytiphilus stammeri]
MIPFVMMFPGQGSQSIGMLINIAKFFPIIKQTFYEASEVLNYDLWKLTKRPSIKELNYANKRQPVLLTSSVSIFRLWKQLGGPIPTMLVGHSLGEYSALVCSGTIPFSEAISLVQVREKMMHEIALKDKGAMLIIIGLNQDKIFHICKDSARGQIVTPANFNSPKQIVISGHKEAVMRAGLACKKSGAKVLPLPINIASHCELLKPMAMDFAKELEEITIKVPQIPTLNNVDVKCESSPAKIRSALIRQLYSPVRWIECVEYIKKSGINIAIEVGPGKVLMGLTKRINSDLTIINLENNNNLSSIIKKLKRESLL